MPLNGAPYISGSVAFDGEAKDNKLILESNTKIDLHNSQYFSDEEGKDIYDERITRLMGAFGINSNIKFLSIQLISSFMGQMVSIQLVQPLKFWVL
ncbi:hypothetical protein C5O32_08470 [Campylobacter jejuni]|nr:hypothetical protein [Campylobacter jejuni]EAJ4309758.1 hypothetical protein [Campylobacter jejuni]ECK2561114.1 hypothetical protein [Campylobacter jejuni]ECR0771246.1 hypothetical protein [Campylobacter jejuni]